MGEVRSEDPSPAPGALVWVAALALVTLIAAGVLRVDASSPRPCRHCGSPASRSRCRRVNSFRVRVIARLPCLRTAPPSCTPRTSNCTCEPLDQLEAVPIRGTEGTGERESPFFSPDGQWIGFWQSEQFKKVSITGGAPVVLCSARNPWGASWTAENTILYGQGAEGIWRVSGDGGKPENVVKVDADQIASGPQLLPGGRAILFTLARTKTRTRANRGSVARHRHRATSWWRKAPTRDTCQQAISCMRSGARCWRCPLTWRRSR